MDTETADELDLLRARAYGPSADIQTDEAALMRLRELEDRARAGEAAPSATTMPDSLTSGDDQLSRTRTVPEPVRSQADASGPASADAGEDALIPGLPPADDMVPPSRTRVSRTTRLVWAASVLATAVLASAATYGLVAMAPVSTSSGAPQIATLHPQPLGEVPSGWFGAGPSSRAWEFYGLTLFETSSGMFGGGGDCVMVVASEQVPAADEPLPDNWSLSGLATSACRVGAFPATIELTVDSSAPQELRAAYPDSYLQFVKQGDEIGVFHDQR